MKYLKVYNTTAALTADLSNLEKPYVVCAKDDLNTVQYGRYEAPADEVEEEVIDWDVSDSYDDSTEDLEIWYFYLTVGSENGDTTNFEYLDPFNVEALFEGAVNGGDITVLDGNNQILDAVFNKTVDNQTGEATYRVTSQSNGLSFGIIIGTDAESGKSYILLPDMQYGVIGHQYTFQFVIDNT